MPNPAHTALFSAAMPGGPWRIKSVPSRQKRMHRSSPPTAPKRCRPSPGRLAPDLLRIPSATTPARRCRKVRGSAWRSPSGSLACFVSATSAKHAPLPATDRSGAVRGPERRHDGLTRLRLVFIGWVVVFHLDLLLRLTMDLPWLRPLIETGYLGVDGFFLLSGFVLWLGYGSRPPTDVVSLGQFWLRRFARTWPLHALVLLALAALVGLVVAMGGRIHDPERFGLRDFLLQAVLVHAWETTERLTWNSPSWALSVEWAGYLAFPLLVQAWRQVPAIVLLPATGLCLAGLWVMAEL